MIAVLAWCDEGTGNFSRLSNFNFLDRTVSGSGPVVGQVVLVCLVAPLVPNRQRRPEALVVGVVDRVRLADEPDARTGVLRAPRLRVAGKFVLVLELDGGARIHFLLLGRTELVRNLSAYRAR